MPAIQIIKVIATAGGCIADLDGRSLLMKILHGLTISQLELETPSLLAVFASVLRCHVNRWLKIVINSPVWLWYMHAIILTCQARSAHLFNSCMNVLNVPSGFLIRLKAQFTEKNLHLVL